MGFTELSITWEGGTNLIGEYGVQNMCTDTYGNIFCTTNDEIIYLEYNGNASSPSWTGSLLWNTPKNISINGICVDNLGYVYCTIGSSGTFINDSAIFRINIKTLEYTSVVFDVVGTYVERNMRWPIGIVYYENHLYIAMHAAGFIGVLNAITLNTDMLYPNFNFIGGIANCWGLSIQTNFSNQNTITGEGYQNQQNYFMAVLFISCPGEDYSVQAYWLTQGFNFEGKLSYCQNNVYAITGSQYMVWSYQNPSTVPGSTWTKGSGGSAITTSGGLYFYITNFDSTSSSGSNNFVYTMENGYNGDSFQRQPYAYTEVYPTSTTALAYNPVIYGVIFASLEPTANTGVPTGIYSLFG